MIHEHKYRLDHLRRAADMLARHVKRAERPLSDIAVLEPAPARFDCPEDSGDWQPISVGEAWGGGQQWALFRGKAEVPAEWKGGRIELRMSHDIRWLAPARDDHFPAGPEGQLFIDGQRVGAIDACHKSIRHAFKPGRTSDVRAVVFAGRCPCRHRLGAFSIAWVDAAADKLAWDLTATLDVIDQLDEASMARERLIRAVEAAIDALNLTEIANDLVPAEIVRDPRRTLLYESVPAAQRAFDERMQELPDAGEVPQISAVGHAHIDLGWLWPMSQTRHKCVRTFATQVRLLEQYPEWVFLQSSPQAYAWVKADAPDLFERIRQLINDGRWEANGAMWVEADTNVPSGESLVRQLLYGKRYFRERLGVDSKVLWLPDVFGYSAALPQILKLADVHAFITSKISWSQFNRFPHDAFAWRGIDGTELPTQFITTPSDWRNTVDTYNAQATASELHRQWDRFSEKHLLHEPSMSFGFGDGGGGPNEIILERVTRYRGPRKIEAMPQVKLEPVARLAERLVRRAGELFVWDGELYLELHRGTYTSHGWLKRFNRKNEIRLHNVEWLASLAADHGYELDKEKLDELWRNLLLIQFHDILPGSSVTELYDEVRPIEQRIADAADDMVAAAATTVAEQVDTSQAERPVVLFNTLSTERSDPVKLPDGSWRDDVILPAGGWAMIDAAAPISRDEPTVLQVTEDGRRLSNRWWSIHLDEAGRIDEVYDQIHDRQILRKGETANEWQVFEDRPLNWDAWDIDLHATDLRLEDPTLASIHVVERGEVRVAVELLWRLPQRPQGESSVITQRIALYAASPRIDFETHVDWHEHHKVLKVAFPVDVRATEATCEIQFGHLSRPTHRDTSWDLAKFEICAHRFIDLSEHGFGVALLNDCKYGHDVRDNVLRLTCIKSAQAPSAVADQGGHEFTYALLPHAGDFQDAGVPRAAAELNTPPVIVEPGSSQGELPVQSAFIACDNDAVVIDTVKPAEDGKGLIVRLYEAFGSHARATLTLPKPAGSVQCVNLLEEPLDQHGAMTHEHDKVTVEARPFEIVTLRVR